MSQQRQQDVRIADQERDWDGPEPVEELEKSEMDREPMRTYLEEE